MPDIWHLAAPPWEGDLFVAGEFERTAHVWSLGRRTPVAVVDTVFDPGGRRLALVTGDTPVVVAGAWARHGVCGYSLTGEPLWEDRTQSHVQDVTALAHGRVAVGHARGPARVLDGSTGAEVRSLRGVTGVHALTPTVSLLESSAHYRLADTELEPLGRRIELRSFAVLAAAASAEHVAVAEAGGPLRILDLDGTERAAYAVPGGHVVSVAHDRATGTWRAVTRVERQDEVDHRHVRLSDDGEVLDEHPLGDVLDATWLRDGGALVLSSGIGLVVLDGHTKDARLLATP